MEDRAGNGTGAVAELTAERIHCALRDGSLDERQALVDLLPAHPLKSTVRLLMDAASPCTPVAALAALAQEYCYGRDPAVGAPLAAALYVRGSEIMRSEADHSLLSLTLSRLAFAHFRALARLRIARADVEVAAAVREARRRRSAAGRGRRGRAPSG